MAKFEINKKSKMKKILSIFSVFTPSFVAKKKWSSIFLASIILVFLILNSVSKAQTECTSVKPPSNLYEEDITSNSATLNWTPGSGGDYQALLVGTDYEMVRQGCPRGITPNSGCVIHTYLSPTQNSFTINVQSLNLPGTSILNPNTTYYWAVVNIKAPNCFSGSNIKSFMTLSSQKRTLPISYSEIKSIVFPGPPHRPFLSEYFDEQKYKDEIIKIKNLGFNTVWLPMFWQDFENPGGQYNASTLNNLKKTLGILKENGMYAILPLNYLGGIWPKGYMGGDVDLANGGTGYSGLFLVDNFTWNGFVKYVDYISKSLANYDNIIFLLFS